MKTLFVTLTCFLIIPANLSFGLNAPHAAQTDAQISANTQNFKGDRRPGILAKPEIAATPSRRDLKRVEELQIIHRLVNPDAPADSSAMRELPSPEAI